MQYILSEEEFNEYQDIKKELEELKANIDKLKKEAKDFGYRQGLEQPAIDALYSMLTINGRHKQIPESWLWRPIDGKLYIDENNFIRDFRAQLSYLMLKYND